jgi:hypothetical protein
LNNRKISKLHSERNQEQQNALGEWLLLFGTEWLPFGAESTVIQFATLKCKG